MSNWVWAVVGLILIMGIASEHGSPYSNALYYPQFQQPYYRPVFGPVRPPVLMQPQPRPYLYQPPYPFLPPPEPPQALQRLSNKDLASLAVNVYRESRGEPQLAQAMVAYVTLNRTRYGDYFGGPSVQGVVFKEHQFSWTDTSLRNRWPRDQSSLQTAFRIAQWVASHGPPSGEYSEALFFANMAMVSPGAKCQFLDHLIPIGTIGRLTFFRYPHPGERPRGCGENRYAQG